MGLTWPALSGHLPSKGLSVMLQVKCLDLGLFNHQDSIVRYYGLPPMAKRWSLLRWGVLPLCSGAEVQLVPSTDLAYWVLYLLYLFDLFLRIIYFCFVYVYIILKIARTCLCKSVSMCMFASTCTCGSVEWVCMCVYHTERE